MAFWNRGVRSGICLTVSLLLATGCGPVDLQRMKPMKWKPSAEVLLYQTPVRWQSGSVVQAAAATGVVSKAVYVSSLQGPSGLLERMNSSPAALVVVVSGTQLSRPAFQVTSHKLGTRFEVIQKTPFPKADINVREVVADLPSAAYTIGWLAGQLASIFQSTSIGWVSAGTTTAFSTTEQAALGELYQAWPLAKISPVIQATQGASVAGTSLSNPILPAPTSMPKVIIADRPLSPAEYELVKTAGSIVLSLTPQTGDGVVVAEPALPSLNSLTADLEAFRNLQWKPGIVPVRTAPFIEVNASLIPATLGQSLSEVERSVEQEPLLVRTAWASVPQTIRDTWLTQLQ